MNVKLMYLCLSVVGGATIQRRDTNANPPCFVSDSSRQDEPAIDCVQLKEYLPSIKLRIKAMSSEFEGLLKSMADKDCVDISNVSYESASFMSVQFDLHGNFKQNLCNNTDTFLEIMGEHYDILNNLAFYFEHLRMTANEDSPIESPLNYIYDCMCDMKTALRASKQDPVTTVPSGDLAELFVQHYNGSTCDRHISQYIVVLDGYRISANFVPIYEE